MCDSGASGGKELTLDQAFKNMFIGVAFLIIAIVLSRTDRRELVVLDVDTGVFTDGHRHRAVHSR